MKPLKKKISRDTLNVLQTAPPTLLPESLQSKTTESTRPFTLSCFATSVVPQVSSTLVSPSREQRQAEQMGLLQAPSPARYVKTSRQISMNAETLHYWCRLWLGKADMQVQALGCVFLPSTPLRRAPIMPEQHPGSRTPGWYVWAQAHLLFAQSSTPWWWCWWSLAAVQCPWQWAGRHMSPPGGWRFLPDLPRVSENAKQSLM